MVNYFNQVQISFQKMEDDLNFSGNGRRPQFFKEGKMTSIQEKGIRLQFDTS